MKRVGGLFGKISDRRILSLAAYRAAQGKRDRLEVREFFARFAGEVSTIGRALRLGELGFDGYRSFPVRDTKSREIHAPSFRDRVVHHAIIAAVGPVLEKSAIEHSYACRKGKGQHAALLQAKRWTRAGEWYGKMDVEKFYDSVDHDILRDRLARRFRERRLLDLFDRLLDSYRSVPGKGLPIGALTSQYLGNFLLDEVDWKMKQVAGAKRYLRYMDDSLCWAADRSGLLDMRDVARGALEHLNLKLKNGGEWNRCDRGVPFVGFVVYPDRIRLNANGKKRLRRKLKELERDHLRGKITDHSLQVRSEAMFAHARWGDDLAWRQMIGKFSRYPEK